MEVFTTQVPYNQMLLISDKEYFYTINPFEVSNVLGATVATLQEYTITGAEGEIYKLYKTKEGNWYDITEVKSSQYNHVLASLKAAIDLKENPPVTIF